MARGHTNLTYVDIQGEPGGNVGVQQHQGSVQKTWGESWWEEIVHAPQQGEVDLTTPWTRCRMHQEQRQRDAQWVGSYQNTTLSSTLVRRNLTSHLQGASMCRVELIPTDKQYGLPPCTMQEPSCLQLQRGNDFVQQQRRFMQQGQRTRRWCGSS